MNNYCKYNFVIITPGRSGSEHLSETLHTCGDIEMEGEVFNRATHTNDSFNAYVNSRWWLRLLSFFFNREKLSKINLNLPLDYLVGSFLSGKQSTKIVKGFKLTLDQLDAYPRVIELLINHGCNIIYLNREDRLAQILSLMKARKTGSYHYRAKNEENTRYTLDKKLVKRHLSKTVLWESTLIKKLEGIDYFSISYEQMFQDYEQSINRIRKFLNLSESTNYQYSDLVKTSNKGLDQWVDNLDEIKKYLED